MRVFISYSFPDKELYIITLLVSKLQESGHTVYLSDHSQYSQRNLMYNSDIFIGIVTNNSDSINAVFTEWDHAKLQNKKTVLLIEQGVKVNDPQLEYISFHRNRPQEAINRLFGISSPKPDKTSKKQDDWTDVLTAGAILAGLAALITLLSGNGKK